MLIAVDSPSYQPESVQPAKYHPRNHHLGLEQDGHEGWNSYDFALKSNSTACKILPVRLNATFYYPGSGTNA